MYCQKCGKENAAEAKFCGSCGAGIGAATVSSDAVVQLNAANNEMTFTKAISTCLGKYFDFKGRAARPEYWWFYLFTVILTWGSLLVDSSQVISSLLSLAFFFPGLAAGARRLHDTNRSGWWQLLSLTIIGLIPLIIWLASKGDEGPNQHGEPV